MKLPRSWLVFALMLKRTPLPVFPEMTLQAPWHRPANQVIVRPSGSRSMPSPLLGRGLVPEMSVPMKLPST